MQDQIPSISEAIQIRHLFLAAASCLAHRAIVVLRTSANVLISAMTPADQARNFLIRRWSLPLSSLPARLGLDHKGTCTGHAACLIKSTGAFSSCPPLPLHIFSLTSRFTMPRVSASSAVNKENDSLHKKISGKSGDETSTSKVICKEDMPHAFKTPNGPAVPSVASTPLLMLGVISRAASPVKPQQAESTASGEILSYAEGTTKALSTINIKTRPFYIPPCRLRGLAQFVVAQVISAMLDKEPDECAKCVVRSKSCIPFPR